ncbi:MAG: hypothetical protein CW342_13550 [Thermoactinomycetaceae bacterium]|nr:hypothetical protein [Bacillota bacterium]MBO2533875.1 hypothetical protein [Thermoactinomycetaceae bacterium]
MGRSFPYPGDEEASGGSAFSFFSRFRTPDEAIASLGVPSVGEWIPGFWNGPGTRAGKPKK